MSAVRLFGLLFDFVLNGLLFCRKYGFFGLEGFQLYLVRFHRPRN